MAKGDLTRMWHSAHNQIYFEERRQYEKQREELNISHLIGTSLGANPDNEINTVEFFKKKNTNIEPIK